jgi:hypothetical protein
VPFELIDLDTDRLVAGSRARVCARLAGRILEFDVEVLAADDERLALVATGPIRIDAEYALHPAAAGSELRASGISPRQRPHRARPRPGDRCAPRGMKMLLGGSVRL